jgi:hypothetical protein
LNCIKIAYKILISLENKNSSELPALKVVKTKKSNFSPFSKKKMCFMILTAAQHSHCSDAFEPY